MDDYCFKWSSTGKLCEAELIKLVTNITITFVSLASLYKIYTAKKHLVRFW